MRTYSLTAIALAAGVVTPRLGFGKRGKRARGERSTNYTRRKRCPNDHSYLDPLRRGWYYCDMCGEKWRESELQ
jgi:hypothetical protein